MEDNDEITREGVKAEMGTEAFRRILALNAAREVLLAAGGLVKSAPEATDLHALAVYITTGEDPWAKGVPLGAVLDDTAKPDRDGIVKAVVGILFPGIKVPEEEKGTDEFVTNWGTRVTHRHAPGVGGEEDTTVLRFEPTMGGRPFEVALVDEDRNVLRAMLVDDDV